MSDDFRSSMQLPEMFRLAQHDSVTYEDALPDFAITTWPYLLSTIAFNSRFSTPAVVRAGPFRMAEIETGLSRAGTSLCP